MDNDDEAGWAMVVEFDDQSASFANGFTCGQVWERMKGEQPITQLVPDGALPTIGRMAQARGWSLMVEDMRDNAWLEVRLSPPRT